MLSRGFHFGSPPPQPAARSRLHKGDDLPFNLQPSEVGALWGWVPIPSPGSPSHPWVPIRPLLRGQGQAEPGGCGKGTSCQWGQIWGHRGTPGHPSQALGGLGLPVVGRVWGEQGEDLRGRVNIEDFINAGEHKL